MAAKKKKYDLDAPIKEIARDQHDEAMAVLAEHPRGIDSTILKDRVREVINPRLQESGVGVGYLKAVFDRAWERVKATLREERYETFPASFEPDGWSQSARWTIRYVPQSFDDLALADVQEWITLFTLRREWKRKSAERHAASSLRDDERVRELRAILRRGEQDERREATG